MFNMTVFDTEVKRRNFRLACCYTPASRLATHLPALWTRSRSNSSWCCCTAPWCLQQTANTQVSLFIPRYCNKQTNKPVQQINKNYDNVLLLDIWPLAEISHSNCLSGAWGGVVVQALRYYSDGPGIDSRWCHSIFQWHIPSDRTMALGSTQPLMKMSTRNISWG